jgi:hypothetical protein
MKPALQMKPALLNLWQAFPDHVAYPTLKDLFTWLGGTAEKNINAPSFRPMGILVGPVSTASRPLISSPGAAAPCPDGC